MMRLKQKLKGFLKRHPSLYNMAFYLWQKRSYPKGYKIRTQRIIRGGGILFPKPGKRVYSERNEDWLVSYVQKTGDYAYLKLDDGTGYLKYSLSNEEKDLASAISCDERLKNLFRYLSLCGVQKLHISMLSREDYKKIQSAWGELAAEFGIRLTGYPADLSLPAWQWAFLYNCCSSEVYDSIWINAVKCIAKCYSTVLIVDDSPLARRLMSDLNIVGKNYFSAKRSAIKKVRKKIKNGEAAEVCITTDIRFRNYAAFCKEKRLFHLPLLFTFLTSSYSDFRHEDDITLNILPSFEEAKAKICIIENPEQLGIDSFYRDTPPVMWDTFTNRKIVNDWWEGACLQDYEQHNRIVMRDGCMYYCDYKNGGYTRTCGERLTRGSSYDTRQDVYMIGPCTIEGFACTDDRTIESVLQSYSDQIHVHNICVPFFWQNIRLRQLSVKENDIICLLPQSAEKYRKAETTVISLKNCYLTDYEEREKLRWDNTLHVNGTMNKYLAETIYEQITPYIKEGGSQKKTRMCSSSADYDFKALWFKYHKGLTEWYDSVKDALVPADKAGAIVMNCNPFTKGHEYLIETARKQVDVLYIFVVEEDKSVFLFAQRFEMVKRATAGMANVVVLPSGNFMISADTLPDYFAKEQLQEQIIDPSYDVILFAEAIAPSIGISVRFAGEEPEDKVTAQYNDWMARLLPEYGIEFKTFRRMESDGSPISGTKVRKLYKENRWEDMRELVPGVVVDYLKECKGSS